jgi:hypothetical protein
MAIDYLMVPIDKIVRHPRPPRGAIHPEMRRHFLPGSAAFAAKTPKNPINPQDSCLARHLHRPAQSPDHDGVSDVDLGG